MQEAGAVGIIFFENPNFVILKKDHTHTHTQQIFSIAQLLIAQTLSIAHMLSNAQFLSTVPFSCIAQWSLYSALDKLT